jgi:hypothetical protein
LLYRDLGDARWPVAVAAGVVACMIAFAIARGIVGGLVATVARPGQVAVAVIIAAGLNLALFAGERAVRSDDTYARTMRREDERVVDRELAAWLARQAAEGVTIDGAAREAEATRLAADNRQFPFRWLLGAALLVAIGAGVWRSRREPAAALAPGLVARAAVVAVASTALVIALGFALG